MSLSTPGETDNGEGSIPYHDPVNSHTPPRRRRISSAVIAILIVITFQHFAAKLMSLPLNRVIEARYCVDYYRIHDPNVIGGPGGDNVPEELCKVDEVQRKLAWLQGSIETIHVLCDLLVTLPLASISDKHGRKLVLALNIVGMALLWSVIVVVGRMKVLPVEAMLFAPVLTLVGGGECVLVSTTAAAVADVVPEQGVRTTVFAYMSSVSYVTALTAPALAAYTMSVDVWLPFWIGLALLLGALPVVGCLPGRVRQGGSASRDERQDGDDGESSALLGASRRNASSQSVVGKAIIQIKSVLEQLYARPSFQLLIGIFFLASLASSNSPLLIQYISKRYGWKFSRAGYLLSVKALVNVTLLTIIIPSLIHLASSRFGISGKDINIAGARINIVISIVGALCIALAAKIGVLVVSLVIYAFGSALPVFTMSMVRVSEKLDGGEEVRGVHGRDYSIVILAKTFGTLIGVPLMTTIWAEGIALGNGFMGLPFYASSVSRIHLLHTRC
jgi:hypothetical protein